MKKALLAAAAVIAMVTGAAAQKTMDNTDNNEKDTYWWYECSVTKVTPPDKSDRDPSYKVMVYLNAKTNDIVKIAHTLRSGKEIVRNDQYTVGDDGIGKTTKGASFWFGIYNKNPNLAMGGTFGWLDSGQAVYQELQFDKRTKGKTRPIQEMWSVCHQV